MVEFIGVDGLLPASYARFQPLATESMVFLLTRLPTERLARKIVDQLMLDPGVSQGRQLCTLIRDMPSLQKLGQIICRMPGLAPEFRQALVELEDNVGSVDYEDFRPGIVEEIRTAGEKYNFDLDEKILAEASVCAVVAADLHNTGKDGTTRAVVKMLKPHLRQDLAHELELLGQLAHFLDRNKKRWGLGDFKFKDTLEQVQWLLENEVNLTLEQKNLETAVRYFRHAPHLVIPRRLPCSTPAMTVMTRVDGRKITDVAGLTQKQKRRLAARLAETCILRPIKDFGDHTIFHGDPHGGNIAYHFEKSKPRIVFYDWGMLGRLNRLERFVFALMALGVVAKSSPAVLFAADIVSGGKAYIGRRADTGLQDAVQAILAKRQSRTGGVLADIGALFRECAYRGVTFPTDLLMYQKALVTLKGVIADIDPGFDTDDQLVWITLGSYLRDLCQPRYYIQLYKEIWALGRYSAGRVLALQRLMLKLTMRMGMAGLRTPLGLMDTRPVPVQVRE